MSLTDRFADVLDLGPSTLANTFRHRLRCEAIGQDFLIEVALPPVPPLKGQSLPVVYVLDGNLAFGMTAQVARMIQFGPFPLPQTLVVGIGYDLPPGQAHLAHVLRLRDLTPWADDKALGQFPMPPGLAHGGAEAFLGFIRADVRAFVESRYPASSEDQTLVGMSLSGLFALYALLKAPGEFRRCLAISPALWWAGGKLFDLEAELAGHAKDLPATLFLGAGGLEELHDADSRLVSNLYALQSRLEGRHYPGLTTTLKVFNGETHMSVFPGAVARGLSEVFGGPGDVSDWSRALDR
jgi:predicted alpha/beta superfamily hydrolase